MKTERKTDVNVYEPLAGEEAMIFELGIPVVKTGDVFHVDVRQKVPLSVDRNNVTPKYLKRLRAATLDATYARLTPEQSSNKGVTDGLADASPVAIATVLDMRFGQRRFVPDFNREATGALTAEGFTAVPPNAFDKETFSAIKKANALPSGNQLRPKLTVAGIAFADDKVTDAMKKFRAMTEMIAKSVLDKEVVWKWSDTPGATVLAQCGPSGEKAISLTVNVARLGVEWFSESPARNRENLDLIFHELGHHNGAMDCTREHCDAVTFIASSVAVLMMTRPTLFTDYV